MHVTHPLYVYAVRLSYADHVTVFSTLAAAQAEANFELPDFARPTPWEQFYTDMQGVDTWESSHTLADGSTGKVTITKYPLGASSHQLAFGPW